MKEIYAWAPWFRELAQKIAEGGEAYLIEQAKQVDWGADPALLKYGDENIDPFSFFYFLAAFLAWEKAQNQRQGVFSSVHDIFEIEGELPNVEDESQRIVPASITNADTLFHHKGEGDPELLWRLFRQAIKSVPDINPADFESVLEIHNVAVVKLTQCLHLINPDYFVPVDSGTLEFHEGLDLPSYEEAKEKIKEENGWKHYKYLIKKFHTTFPECSAYEISTALYKIYQWKKDGVPLGRNFFQVSTYVHGSEYRDEEHWDKFSDGNCVYTGGPFRGRGWEDYKQGESVPSGQVPYPIRKPKCGDLIFVRTGLSRGRGIGIVYKNDYAERLRGDSAIHVLWLNKASTTLAGRLAFIGFSSMGESTVSHNVVVNTDAYKPIFNLIQHIREKQGISQSPDNAEEDNMKEDSPTNSNQPDTPLNRILYGPPGTGKTWNTVNHALAIIEERGVKELEEESRKDRVEVKRRFDELKKETGQIEMVTFHQNFAYEDFIEGIKPDLEGGDNLQYKMVDGVFKEIALRAEKNLEQSAATAGDLDVEALLQDFAQHINDRIDQGETILMFPRTKYRSFISRARTLSNGKIQFQLAIGEKEIKRVSSNTILRDFKKYSDGKITLSKQIKPTRKSSSRWHGDRYYLITLMEQMEAYRKEKWQPEQRLAEEKQNYVLIIDEINRGNIARIFGELITLIEPSKRLGRDDAASVTLPYSQEEFNVPDNLYIIGAMNTADRSIALLDTALRRRFDFIEMMPNPKHPRIETNIDGVNCQKMLEEMNKRITVLLDRDHQLGHSYLIGVDSMEKLARVFQNQIIPLLQEYFYDDWKKIDLVLNGNGFVKVDDVDRDLFKDADDVVDANRKIYELIGTDNDKWEKPASYISIYSSTSSPSQSDDSDGE